MHELPTCFRVALELCQTCHCCSLIYSALQTDTSSALVCSMDNCALLFLMVLLPSQQIAEKELREKKIPFTVRRYLPDGTYEDWSVEELIQPSR